MSRLRFGLVGHPVGHSVSPAMHQAAYAALGVNATYEAIDAPDEAALVEIVAEVRAGRLAGANVTVPWKRRAYALADDADPSAEEVGAANVLSSLRGRVVAHNTDVAALADDLRDAGAHGHAVVLGSGGAAFAAVVACRFLGAPRVQVVARRFAAGESDDVAERFAALGADCVPWPAAQECVDLEAGACGVVVQATSAGMPGGSPGEDVAVVVPWTRLAREAVAYDLVYNPPTTPFLEAARAAGVVGRGGLGMLVGQALGALRIWLARAPDPAVLRTAAERALGDRVHR